MLHFPRKELSKSIRQTNGTAHQPKSHNACHMSQSHDHTRFSLLLTTFRDVLELKMIQRSLPRAQQHHDPLSSRPYSSVFLRHVPIPLLPLNPITVSVSPSPSPTSVPSSPVRSTPPRFSALDLHPNSIFFTSPPKSWCKPTPSPPQDSYPFPVPPPPFLTHTVPIPSPPPAPSELRPHNITVPPPPLPPARTSTALLPPTPTHLPPPKRFAFLPLLDHTSASLTSNPKNEPDEQSSPQTFLTHLPLPLPPNPILRMVLIRNRNQLFLRH